MAISYEPSKTRKRLPVFKGRGGLVASVDPLSNKAMLEALGERSWLENALAAAEHGRLFIVMPMVLASMLRLVTSPKIFVAPTPVADAVAFADAILAMPGVQLACLGSEWPRLRQLCLDKQLTGKDLPDAWLASAVAQQAEHLVSFDRDFKKLLPRSSFTHLSRSQAQNRVVPVGTARLCNDAPARL